MRCSMGSGPTGLRVALCLSALVLGSTQLVHAQVPPSDPGAATATPADTDREARFLFEAGRTAYDGGRYRESLAHFQRAYELSQRPQLLYNVGQAADRLREDELALDAFERYLSALPAAANRPAVEERIKVLREVLAEKQAAAAATQAPTPAETAASAPSLASDVDGYPTSTRDEGEDESLLSKWWLWAAAGGVVAGVVVGVLIASSGGDGGGKVKGDLVEGSDGKVLVALEPAR